MRRPDGAALRLRTPQYLRRQHDLPGGGRVPAHPGKLGRRSRAVHCRHSADGRDALEPGRRAGQLCRRSRVSRREGQRNTRRDGANGHHDVEPPICDGRPLRRNRGLRRNPLTRARPPDHRSCGSRGRLLDRRQRQHVEARLRRPGLRYAALSCIAIELGAGAECLRSVLRRGRDIRDAHGSLQRHHGRQHRPRGRELPLDRGDRRSNRCDGRIHLDAGRSAEHRRLQSGQSRG